MKKKIILFILVADIFLILSIIYLIVQSKDTLIYIRQILYIKILDNPEVFKITKTEAKEKYNFFFEDEDIIAEYFQILKKNIDYLSSEKINEINHITDISKKARYVALLYSKNGGPRCGEYKNLIHNIQRLNKNNGMGCCSDHSDAFIAFSHIFGLNAREVHNKRHTYNEFYDPVRKKWTWIDTQFALMALNDKNEYMSLLEMMITINEGKKIHYYFFGNSNHQFYNSQPEEHEFYFKKNFSQIMMTMGDNVFSQDRFATSLNFLPKFVRQFIALNIGIQPGYILYTNKKNSDLKKQNQMKYLLKGLYILYIIINMLAVFQMIFFIYKTRNKSFK